MTINERILALRRAAGLSQEALAEQVGVSRQAIGKWESGASLPGLDNLQELARALDVSCDELLTGCCFLRRMRKFFTKNEKSMLQNCNKIIKQKGHLHEA